jgi:hypothetical protein
MSKSKKISKKEFKKIQQNFECFFKDEENKIELFNTLVNHASKTMPSVDVTNPSTLLDVAANPNTPESVFSVSVLLLIFILLIIISG